MSWTAFLLLFLSPLNSLLQLDKTCWCTHNYFYHWLYIPVCLFVQQKKYSKLVVMNFYFLTRHWIDKDIHSSVLVWRFLFRIRTGSFCWRSMVVAILIVPHCSWLVLGSFPPAYHSPSSCLVAHCQGEENAWYTCFCLEFFLFVLIFYKSSRQLLPSDSR